MPHVRSIFVRLSIVCSVLAGCSIDIKSKIAGSPNQAQVPVPSPLRPVTVIAGNGGIRLHTLDGGAHWEGEWDSAGLNDCFGYRDFAYGNGKWIAVSWTGGYNRVSTSPDGVHWRHLERVFQTNTIAYGNGIYLAEGYYSHDGYNFIKRDQVGVNELGGHTRFRFEPKSKHFIASGHLGGVAYSTDGITFIQTIPPIWDVNKSPFSWAIGNGIIVATQYRYLIRSDDGGVTWTIFDPIQGHLSSNDWLARSVYFDGTKFILDSGTSDYESTDGLTWIKNTLPHFAFIAGDLTTAFGMITQLVSGNVVDASNFSYSRDGVTFQNAESVTLTPSAQGIPTDRVKTTQMLTGMPSSDPNGPPPTDMPPSVLLTKDQFTASTPCDIPFDRQ